MIWRPDSIPWLRSLTNGRRARRGRGGGGGSRLLCLPRAALTDYCSPVRRIFSQSLSLRSLVCSQSPVVTVRCFHSPVFAQSRVLAVLIWYHERQGVPINTASGCLLYSRYCVLAWVWLRTVGVGVGAGGGGLLLEGCFRGWFVAFLPLRCLKRGKKNSPVCSF